MFGSDLQQSLMQAIPFTPQDLEATYLAICEFHINLKHISPDFIAALVALHF